MPFEVAWSRRIIYALPPASAPQQRALVEAALWATRPAWRRAYEGVPPEAGEMAAAELAATLAAVRERRAADDDRPQGLRRGVVLA